MIGKELFKQQIAEISLLIGQQRNADQEKAIFERLSGYEESDFMAACRNNDLIRTLSKNRMNLPDLLAFMDRERGLRIEREAQDRKKQEEKELKELIDKEGIPEEVKSFLRKVRTW